MNRYLAVSFLLLVCLAPLSAGAEEGRENVLDRAKELMRDGDAQSAFELLVSYEERWADNVAYDYLLGLAALDSGNASEAVFALQRVVTQRRDFSGGRLELARAYFDLGENETARREFELLLAESPPDNVREAIDAYLIAIDQRARRYRATVLTGFDLGWGFDTNTPAATSDEQFLSFRLSPNNLEQESAFYRAAVSGVWSRPMSPEAQFIASLSIAHRENPSTQFVDSSSAMGSLAVNWQKGRHSTSLAVTGIASWLAEERNKDDVVAGINYAYKVSDSWQLAGMAQHSAVRFEDVLAIQDVDRTVVGLGLHQFGDGSQFSVTLLGSGDDVRQTGSLFGNEGVGLQLGKRWLRPGGQFFANAVASRTEYDLPFYGIDREDDLAVLTLGHTWIRPMGSGLNFTVQLAYSERSSTVSLYEFERWEFGFILQRPLR